MRTQSFFVLQSRRREISDQAMRDEVHAQTGNELETSRIMSALERFGEDTSIEKFEMIPKSTVSARIGSTIHWTVRALRSVPTRQLVRPWERTESR